MKNLLRFGLVALSVFFLIAPSWADDCKRVQNILILFDTSGYMKEKNRYEKLLQQASFFAQGMPLTADGFFNVGLRHYGLKVGLGCENTEAISAVQAWDPERFLNSFPKTVSYGTSALAAGLRAAADDLAGAEGKSIIVVLGGGLDSCKGSDPIQIAERVCQNNPDLEIHTFQLGNSPDGKYIMQGIAAKGKGTYHWAEEFSSSANWHAWMKQYMCKPCPGPTPASQAKEPETVAVVTFDPDSFSVRSKDPVADAANVAALQAVVNALRANPQAKLIIHGFTTAKGSLDSQIASSKKRAEIVAKHLISGYKVSPGQISVVARGPAPSTLAVPPGAQHRFARRVEFELVQ